jgi:hypothetical protein
MPNPKITKDTTLKELLDAGFVIRRNGISFEKTKSEFPYHIILENPVAKGIFCDGTFLDIDLATEFFLQREKDLKNVKKEPLLTKKEVQFAAENRIPVIYKELYANSEDKHLNFHGVCTLEKASKGWYIGNSDIDLENWKENDFISGDFPEGKYSVHAAPNQKYKK